MNQDSLFVRKLDTRAGKKVFAVLCDGMGGHEYGEIASAAIISAFTDWMYSKLPVLAQNSLEDYVIRKQWNDIIECQNEQICSYGFQKGCVVGSTVTALLLTEYRYYLLNVGDTRAYEIAENVIQLTEDHKLIEKEKLKKR